MNRAAEARRLQWLIVATLGATSLKLERMPTLETAKAQMADAVWVIQKILATRSV